MDKQKWFYYVQVRSGAVAKVNIDSFHEHLVEMGFTRCTYSEYLRKRKLLRDREQKINFEGRVNDEQ